MSQIKEILQDLGYDVSRGSSTDFSCRPKYRESDNNTALCVNKTTGEFFDFVTKQRGSINKLIRLTLNFETDGEAEKWLENKSYHIQEASNKPILKLPKVYDNIFLLPNNFFFNERGISDKTLKFFEAGLASGGQMYQRYTFPLKGDDGSTLGFAGRIVVEKENAAKWKIVGKKMGMNYPWYYTRNELIKSDTVVLVESIGDLLALHECGIYGFCMLGTVVSPAIIGKLIEINPKKIIVATNDDSGNNSVGNLAAEEIIKKLSNFFDSKKLFCGCPIGYNDLSALFQKEGAAGIREWRNGIEIDL